MKAKLLFIAVIAAATCFTACKKTGPEGPTGPQGSGGPVLTGNLKGFINHYDLSGAKMITGLAGDTVSIDGTSTMSITDSAGFYSFTGLTTGVYNLTIKHSTFGMNKVQGLQFTGGGDTYRNANISKVPTTNVATFTAYDTTISTINYIRVKGTVTAAPYIQTVIVYVGASGSSTVSASTADQVNFYTINVAANSTNFVKNIATSDFYDLGYPSATSAFFAAYMIGGNTNASSYADLTNNRTVFTAISAAPVLSNALVQ